MFNNNLQKGIICIISSCFFFTLMSVFIKLSLSNLLLIETLFLRSLSAFLILATIIYIKKKNYKTLNFKLHFLRSVIGTLAMLCMFYSLSNLPISNVIIISFSKIFFIIPLAVFFLREKLSISSFFLICIGFVGVIIAIGAESYKNNSYFYIFAFSGAFLIALVKILIKKIVRVEDTFQIQFWFAFLSTSFLLIPYFLTFVSLPSLLDMIIVFCSAVCGLSAQFFTIIGLKLADATKVLPFDFFRVIFGIIFGITVFSENITFGVLLGGLLILFSSILLIKKA